MKVVQLYRPVGFRELELIAQSGYRAFPPRLPEQPIFYPVLTFEYAHWIVTNWNINESVAGYGGAITQFSVRHDFIEKYPVKIAGGVTFQELWIPSEELDVFNENIVGVIGIAAACYGEQFTGPKVNIDDSLSREPSKMFIEANEFAKTDEQYQEWLERNRANHPRQ